MQGKQESMLTSSDKLTGFLNELTVWKLHAGKKYLKMFPGNFEIDPHGT